MERTRDGVIAGVCGGIANDLGFDVFFVRFIFIILAFTDFPIIVMYILVWIFTSEERR